jgi:pimeloyl-ACP methyl ester carboxylesterase
MQTWLYLKRRRKMTKTIALIHGLSVSKHSWDGWAAHYRARGYNVVAIPYLGRDLPLQALRQNYERSILTTITLPQLLDYLVTTIRALDEKPIIMGHSFGGLLTQLLLQRDLGVAGVTIDSAPPPGVLPTQWSFVRSTWAAFNPLISASKPWYMTFAQFQYAWTHTLPLAEQRAAYEEVIVPESRRLYRSGLTKAAAVDFAKTRPPLLMIAGGKDHILPASLNRSNYERYAKSPSVTEFKLFPQHTHYTIVAGSHGWEEVADYALEWATKMQPASASRTTPAIVVPMARQPQRSAAG